MLTFIFKVRPKDTLRENNFLHSDILCLTNLSRNLPRESVHTPLL